MEPFLPFTAKKLCKFLNIEINKWSSLEKENLLEIGHVINSPEILFSKIEDEKIDAQIAKLTQASKSATNSIFEPMKESITFDDFTKMDIRVGEIKTAEKVEKADKLLKLTIDTGIDVRTVVSGIAEHYKPEDVIGKKVSVLLNLAPRKIRGIESQGMILMAENSEGKLSFVSPEFEMEVGGSIK